MDEIGKSREAAVKYALRIMTLRGIAEEVDSEIKELSQQLAAIAPDEPLYIYDDDEACFRASIVVTRRLKVDEDMLAAADPVAYERVAERKVSTTKLKAMIADGTVEGWDRYAKFVEQSPSVRFQRVFEDGGEQ